MGGQLISRMVLIFGLHDSQSHPQVYFYLQWQDWDQ